MHFTPFVIDSNNILDENRFSFSIRKKKILIYDYFNTIF